MSRTLRLNECEVELSESAYAALIVWAVLGGNEFLEWLLNHEKIMSDAFDMWVIEQRNKNNV